MRIDPHPLLRIDREQVVESDSGVYVRSPLYHPEERYHELVLAIRPPLVQELARLAQVHQNELVAALNCSEVVSLRRMSPSGWGRFIQAGVYNSEAEALRFAARFGVKPTVHRFDPEDDEYGRIGYLRAVLGDYALEPDARARIAREKPDLYEFLEAHPKYWQVLTDVEAELRR